LPPLCASATFVPSFAASARMAVELADLPQPMPLVRLDRHGLVATVADDVGLPPLGLPRPARVFACGESISELRLVPRTLIRPAPSCADPHFALERLTWSRPAPPFELTMQPSRADDDLIFWKALYARRHVSPDMSGTFGRGDDMSAGLDTGVCDDIDIDMGAGGLGIRAGLGTDLSAYPVHPHQRFGHDSCCEVVLEFVDHNEAVFFSEWLEYHFAEIAAFGRAATSAAELHDIDRRRSGAQVTVLFRYRRGSRALSQTTNAICTWLRQEMERLFGMRVRCEIVDAGDGSPLRAGARARPRSHRSRH
jgi:hypothetical protein